MKMIKMESIRSKTDIEPVHWRQRTGDGDDDVGTRNGGGCRRAQRWARMVYGVQMRCKAGFSVRAIGTYFIL